MCRQADRVRAGVRCPHDIAEHQPLSLRYGLEIRAAAPGDAEGLAELLGQPARPLGARLEAMRHAGTVLLAWEYGPPSGVIALHWYRALTADLPAAQIDLLFVAPDARRRGLGRMLIKAGAQAARVAGCGALELVATVQDDTLQAFCLATGFTRTGAVFGRTLRKKG